MTCNCMGPQNGQPLCPCQMYVARAYFTAAAPWVPTPSRTFTTPTPTDEALALLRELNDALKIPGWLQPRVDALLDRAEEKP